MGSKDRRQLTEWVFSWYRIGNWLAQLEFEKRLAVALCFSTENSPEVQDLLAANLLLKEAHRFTLQELETQFDEKFTDTLFPFDVQLSEGIQWSEYGHYLLNQPHLWLRVLHNREGVLAELQQNEIPFDQVAEYALKLAPNAKVSQLGAFSQGDVIVQDLSSQEIASTFANHDGEFWWDCCCGGGGKSLLFLQQNPNGQILATDNRPSILENYAERLETCGFPNFAYKKIDLSEPIKKGFPTFSGVIADVPCTGSGTWARSPEQINACSPERILYFQTLQRSIVQNALPHLRPGGQLVYITCSVFKAENEDNVNFFLKNPELELVESRLINGVERGSDNLFCAILQKIAS